MKAKPTLFRIVGTRATKEFMCRDILEWSDLFGPKAPVDVLGACETEHLIGPLPIADKSADIYGFRWSHES